MFSALWSSPTLNTWASFLSRTVGSLLILPLVLHRFDPADFNVWSLFTIFLGVQLLADMGFCLTFVRAIAAALAGAADASCFSPDARPVNGAPTNWPLVQRIIGTMRYVYIRLAAMYFAGLVFGGTALMHSVINQTKTPASAWLAWGLVVITGYVNLRTSYLGVLLQGLNQIAALRRWEALTSTCAALSALGVLSLGGGLLPLIVVAQFWALLGVWRNQYLCRTINNRELYPLPTPHGDTEILKATWPATWRSGLGVAMSYGLVQATGIIHAQIASAAASASYLFCLRVLQLVSTFSQAPFYSKLPLLSRLYAEGRTEAMIKLAEKSMRLALWAFALGFSAAVFFGADLLQLLGSAIVFPDRILWVLLGTMFFIERYAAMHLHFYNTTNNIITHIANGVTGLLCIVFILGLMPHIGLLAMPAGLLAGYLAFYAWFPAVMSYRNFRMPFLRFELRTSAGPLFCFAVAVTILVYRR